MAPWMSLLALGGHALLSRVTLADASRNLRALSNVSGVDVPCPGTGVMCAGNQCCPGFEGSGNLTFPCPSVELGQKHTCQTMFPIEAPTAMDVQDCLCTFDVDRTLTGKQGVVGDKCPANEVEPNVQDSAYGGGSLTLSAVGQSYAETFCGSCYVGVVTAGDASGANSPERNLLATKLSNAGILVSTSWSGPSKDREARASCEGVEIDSPLVAGCSDGTKQYAVAKIVELLQRTQGVAIAPARVWHFDDRENNVSPFQGTGMNARQISCATRDGEVGLCGATREEIVDAPGVATCGR
uniref:Cellulase n=1 Tax=Zooxanthella nutricula TaxID=1333877 RepID=A0A7S2PMS4_9DINO